MNFIAREAFFLSVRDSVLHEKNYHNEICQFWAFTISPPTLLFPFCVFYFLPWGSFVEKQIVYPYVCHLQIFLGFADTHKTEFSTLSSDESSLKISDVCVFMLCIQYTSSEFNLA